MRAAAAFTREPSGDVGFDMTDLPERLYDFLAHFAAAASEARPDSSHQIARIRMEFPPRRADRFHADLLHRAAPAGVNRRDGARPSIGNQDRRTVGHSNAERRRGIIADDAVGLRGRPGAGVPRPRNGDRPAVNLVQQPKAAAGHARECRDSVPLAVVLTQLDRRRREEVVRNLQQRLAAEDRPPRRLRPHEAIVRLGL